MRSNGRAFKVVEVAALEGIFFEREVFVGAQIVDLELQMPVRLRTPRFLGGGVAVEEDDLASNLVCPSSCWRLVGTRNARPLASALVCRQRTAHRTTQGCRLGCGRYQGALTRKTLQTIDTCVSRCAA